jgi:hypothetical protein
VPNVRLIKHEVIPDCGSFEVRFSDGRPSKYFYWDDLSSRRLRPDLVDSETALEQAKAFARAERGRLRRRPAKLSPAPLSVSPPAHGPFFAFS